LHFGKTDRTDFVILPFALFYFYCVFAAAFNLPGVGTRELFHSEAASWVGTCLGFGGLLLLVSSLVSFGRGFRVGIDADRPDALVTTGVFAFSRNPIYVGFGFVLLGQVLVFRNWILLASLAAGVWLFHRQVLREERFLRQRYGQEYA